MSMAPTKKKKPRDAQPKIPTNFSKTLETNDNEEERGASGKGREI